MVKRTETRFPQKMKCLLLFDKKCLVLVELD